MGLLPKELDYEKLQIDLLMEQVAGFYDPWARQLYIADWLPVAIQAPALAHEIAHALQDQHFDLKRFVQPVHDQGDQQLARSALVEGDGTGVMLEFASHQDLSALPDMAKVMEGAVAAGRCGLTDWGADLVLQSIGAGNVVGIWFDPDLAGVRLDPRVRRPLELIGMPQRRTASN